MMHWRKRLTYPRRGDVVAILLAVAPVDKIGPPEFGQLASAPEFGLGSEWRCKLLGKIDPVCVKALEKSLQPN